MLYIFKLFKDYVFKLDHRYAKTHSAKRFSYQSCVETMYNVKHLYFIGSCHLWLDKGQSCVLKPHKWGNLLKTRTNKFLQMKNLQNLGLKIQY